MKNSERIQRGFEILHGPMAEYICRTVKRVFKDKWWDKILNLIPESRRDLPETNEGTDETKMQSLDISKCLKLIHRGWFDCFSDELPKKGRSWVTETLENRNELAHKGMVDFTDDDTDGVLDTQARLCDFFDAKQSEGIREMLRELRYGSSGGSMVGDAPAPVEVAPPAKTNEPPSSVEIAGLPSWRDVISPHKDVSEGKYKNAEFAANLARVANGEGSDEYLDPVEFFNRTYITDGIKRLLVEAMNRILGEAHGGDPVIQLKTVFGGGKTHSMLALFHALRGTLTDLSKVPGLKKVVNEAGFEHLPKATIAVLVGTEFDPSKSRRPKNMPGITINTLWGEMAYRLATASEKPEIYEYVKEADKHGTSPGVDAMRRMFDECGPCLILMDEIAEYGTKIYGSGAEPSNRFANFLTFIREVTEAIATSKDSLLVASIPESETELVGTGSLATQQTIHKTVEATIEKRFGRLESVWNPVARDEGFEVVRRRLFSECRSEEARRKVCAAYAAMYREHEDDFPSETKEREYEDRLMQCYPIHPEIFDRLYKDWSTLEKFQRTRGVLRLMAAVITSLWNNGDKSPLIMPGSIELGETLVSREFTNYLPQGWNAIIDSEVDGARSAPYKKDKEIDRFGQYMASRRTARTIFFGSAPDVRGQSVRGLDARTINLGVAEPGQNIAVYTDARRDLQRSLAYMYTDSGVDTRTWYDTRPNLNKTADDRAARMKPEDVDAMMKKMVVNDNRGRSTVFRGCVVWPDDSSYVMDEQDVRLVILKPDTPHDPSMNDQSAARLAANEIYRERGTASRTYHNTVVFAAADSSHTERLQAAVRKYLAWMSIDDDAKRGVLDLDNAQREQARASVGQCREAVKSQIAETYRWLFAPRVDPDGDLSEVLWDIMPISTGDGSISDRAADRLKKSRGIAEAMSPMTLLTELDNRLWTNRDDIGVGELWDYICKYCYLPRMTDFEVLARAIRDGIGSMEFFALASGKKDGRYIGLKLNEHTFADIDRSALIVKLAPAMKQKLEDQNKPAAPGVPTPPQPPVDQPPIVDPKPPVQLRPKRFDLSAPIDINRGLGQLNDLWDDVIKHLVNMSGSSVEIRLEVTAKSPDGIPAEVERWITENCKHLGFDEFRVD